MQFKWRDQELPHPLKLANPRQQIEQVRRILAKIGLGRQQSNVRVEARGVWIVVTRAQMQVTTNPIIIAADHETHLRVNLVADQAVNNMHARLLKLPRPKDVVGLIEASPQLHHSRHLLPVLHRVHQGADDLSVAARAVKGLFDGQHARIFSRLLQKIHDRAEIIIRMMQQHIPLTYDREQIGLVLEHGRHRRDEGDITQLGGMIPFAHRHQARRIQRAIDDV